VGCSTVSIASDVRYIFARGAVNHSPVGISRLGRNLTRVQGRPTNGTRRAVNPDGNVGAPDDPDRRL
jgi:hypothetical protein